MTERPILFTAPMVRAILDGRKTQTRRVVKGIPDDAILPEFYGYNARDGLKNSLGWFVAEAGDLWPCNEEDRILCPYGQPGDRLWVRETFSIDAMCGYHHDNQSYSAYEIVYRAGGSKDIEWTGGRDTEDPYCRSYDTQRGDWQPSIYMPRWASRITLEITGVRIERLQDISEEDALAEGIQPDPCGGFHTEDGRHFHAADPRESFGMLWDSVNEKRGFPCASNPWVWVLEFRRVQP